ncbi:MAG: glycosyltransferase family 39 protein [Chthonomonas sp.]|nr:glycosyltransferase family 39 protein [Chthonomonas sp.]
MVWSLVALLICLGPAIGLGRQIRERLEWLDPSEATAFGGCMFLCFIGWGVGVAGGAGQLYKDPGIILITGAIFSGSLFFNKQPWAKPNRWWAVWALLLAFPLLKAWTPSDMLDWDTIAYHFAVPKMWIEAGKMTHVPFIHQSNFPGIVDNLFLTSVGIESFAKSFTVFYWIMGGMWVFGVARRYFGETTAPWAALAFLSAPLILWSSGSGYVDVAHGLFAAMGMLYAAERSYWLSGFGLGAAMASKYTGLQVALAAFLVVVFMTTRERQWKVTAKPLALAGALAILIACPWYVRTYANTGNPVFPFFYEQLGGRGWDQWRADIYRNEQQTFGVGRTEGKRDLSAIGSSILGLAYQPGRYINPAPTEGQGVPMGAIGFALLLGPLAWLCFGKERRVALDPRDSSTVPQAEYNSALRSLNQCLAMTGLLLVMFFLLSQQVRYVTSLAPIWAIMLAGIAVPKWREILRVAVALQAAYTVWLLWTTQAENQFKVVTGIFPREEYQHAVVPFSKAAININQEVGKQGKVALYNEVFGYFLDVPYIWANPGHSMLLPYEKMESGADLVRGLQDIGVTHVYLNIGALSREHRALIIDPTDFSYNHYDNLDIKWIWLLSDALAKNELRHVHNWEQPFAILLEVPKEPGTGEN